jgi:molybdopterin molybdotransferase
MSLADQPLSVAEARGLILASATPVQDIDLVPLHQARGRTLAQALKAQCTQPPQAVSAMDGYAVRADDLASLPVHLDVIGESAAGHGFDGTLKPGEAVRIFTGAPVPDGADAILIQENAKAEGAKVEPLQSVASGRYVRPAGLDFKEGELLLPVGTRLGPSEIALAAAMNHAKAPVGRRPRVAILATGDELVKPGEPIGPNQIVASNGFAVGAIVEMAGGEVVDLGIAGDTFAALENGIGAARDAKADILVTLGGASVGDHDLVKTALAKEGMELGFWRVAMRPGRPLIHGKLGAMSILGLPGNPASSIVCGLLFLTPLIRAMSGDPRAAADNLESAVLGAPLRANDARQDYLRGSLAPSDTGLSVATPFEAQDSSLLRVFAQSQCLIVREPGAPAAQTGDLCKVIRLTSAHF